MNKLPKARTSDILMQEVLDEILIYDMSTHKIYQLNKTLSVVYQNCDGETTFDQLIRNNNLTDDLIFLAIHQLKEGNLLEEDKTLASPFNNMSRREAIKRAGIAAMVALPMISTVIAPTAVYAGDSMLTGGNSCNSGTPCNCSKPNFNSFVPVLCSIIGGTSNCGGGITCDCFVVGGIGSTGGTCTGA